MNDVWLSLIWSVGILGIGMTIVAYLTWLERKVAARFQNRVGPYYVGYPHGWLQPLADILKLIVKEDVIPHNADRLLFNLAPVLVIVPALMGFAFIPIGKDLALVDHSLSLLLMLALSSLTLLGIFAAGWASNNKYALLSALRMVAMLVAYEVPLMFSLLVPALLTGSFRLVDLVEAQRGLPFVLHPFGFIAFVIFLIASLAEMNKTPLDLIEAESELIAAYNTEYAGIKFALFYAGEYAHSFVLSLLVATIFLGGYLGPGLPGIFWLLVKALGVFLLILWIRWSFVRLRIDQALALNWKYLFPLSFLNLLAAAFWILRTP